MEYSAALAEDELKTEFARQWLKSPRDPFKAALAVFGMDTGRALQIAGTWVKDPFVLAEQDRILGEEGPRAGLPSKEEYAQKVLNLYEETDSKTDIEDRTKILRLFGEIMGYIERPAATTINNNNSVQTNRVMIVKEHGSDDDWERRLRTQQQKLIEDGGGPTIQ